ncbi:NAD(P)-dependent dehydrogenase (short-subunit alcohol dehydrogenase family) [Silvimonas terrae]|uniref:NAD(P)-dependent dehydrogenase (Short-subunit alcohol dehydrogenase family) n=1 Tax=Silvimonas terrae TaxID=300266 RepID=A0A840RFN4_9NEIS|nr:SDR family oxidoreductase [Silvimonas terrae]MBB5191176.1 NAD(P)-dependent dehydrogenase (short-subunit alcohol dehydrogenase family) [Silvimonas terrae]
MDLQLEGKRAIVTGGSKGIGKAIARQLAREGADVVIAARGQSDLERAARELAGETGRKVVAVVADTGNADSVNALVAHAVEALGGVDILINAAAVPGGISPARSLAEVVDEEALLDVDLKVIGYLRTARAVAPHLQANGWGRIINIGGLALYRTGRPIASLRNAGVAAISKNLADELGPHGISVVTVHPGHTRTERTDAEAERTASRHNTIGRIVDASEIADIVAFLASPRSTALNGAVLPAGGGIPGVIQY